MVKIYDVAKKAEVSLATVSRVINNPNKVREKTRLRVQAVINELGYVPNAMAQGLASRRSTSIAIVVPNTLEANVSDVLDGITRVAYDYGYRTNLFALESSNDTTEEVLQNVFSTQVDGIIYINNTISESEAKILESSTIPIVLTNSILAGSKLSSVTIDYFEAAKEATKVLINEGRKNIVMISSKEAYSIDTFKEEGYKLTMKKAGYKPNIIRLESDILEGIEEAKDFLKNTKIDGAVGVKDTYAIKFMNAAIDLGYNVPKDISVVAFQNTSHTKLSNPRMSTIDPSINEIGRAAMELLTKIMKNEEIELNAISIPHGYIKRATTKK